MLKTVTITGADNSVMPESLQAISNGFPFVEWAILASRSQQGGNRFPCIEWIKKLVALKNERPDSLNLSLHLCGAYVRELLKGDITFIAQELAEIWPAFDRVQINTHGELHAINTAELMQALKMWPQKEFIFQYDNVPEHAYALNVANITPGINVSALFDLSHGAGVLPKQWPDPLPMVKCGYAGGISPENIQEQIYQVDKVTGHDETWIDMETHVRSNNDKVFDLNKVIACLSKSAPFVDAMGFITTTRIAGDNMQAGNIGSYRDLRDYLNTLSDEQLAGGANIYRTDAWGHKLTETYVLEEDYFIDDEGINPVSSFEEDVENGGWKLEDYPIVPKGTVYLVCDSEGLPAIENLKMVRKERFSELTSVYHELWGMAQKLPGYRETVEKWQQGWSLISNLKR